jgi:paraquat-inducible protein B
VEFYGIQVGTVTSVELDLNPDTAQARARVRFEVQPERIANDKQLAQEDPVAVARRLVSRGMRAQLRTSSYLTGSQVLALDFVPNAPKAELVREGEDWVIPSQSGGLDNILAAFSNISGKLDRLPLDEIGANLNTTLRSASGAMTSIQELANRANSGLSPAFARLPAITSGLEGAITRAERMFGSIDRSYGSNSDIQRELARAMVQVGDTARSVRLLADFLDRHPEALVRGRADYSTTR